MARLAGDTNGMGGARRLVSHERLWAAIGQVLAAPRRDRFACRHAPPARFTPERDLALGLGVPSGLGAALANLPYYVVRTANGSA